MLLSFYSVFVIFLMLALTGPALGRERWLERNSKPLYFYPRRFGQEHPTVLDQLSSACPGEVCGNLAGQAVSTLLADADECTQQNLADQIINASKQFDATTQANMINFAKTFRQAEKNTPPDFTTNPPTNRNSVFCQKAPENPELNGLVQAQDPANDPNVFFDPATGKSVTKGSQANTFPFDNTSTTSTNLSRAVLAVDLESNITCASTVTITVTGSLPTLSTNQAAVTISVGNAVPSASSSPSAIGNFGSCSVPKINFGLGFDNRQETSFEPADKNSYNHGSADDIDIITQFICDTLTNSCDADQTAKMTCASASSAADQQNAKTGAQADAFNAVFGLQTAFAAIAVVNDQGNVVSATDDEPSSESSSSVGNITPTTSSVSLTTNILPTSSASLSTIGNFGSCSTPQIQFAGGFDGRKETSFEPSDQKSFNHGSADDIDIITQFICDALTNTCGADQTAKDTCARASAAADAQPAKTGKQADAFNSVFGIKTDFGAIAAVNDQGATVASSGFQTSSTLQNSPTQPASSALADSSPSSENLQTFNGQLGSAAPAVSAVGNGQFQVKGNDVMNSLQSALQRSCSVQHNACANAANAADNTSDLTVANCDNQETQCEAATNMSQ